MMNRKGGREGGREACLRSMLGGDEMKRRREDKREVKVGRLM
jgi:hypothetical protein